MCCEMGQTLAGPAYQRDAIRGSPCMRMVATNCSPVKSEYWFTPATVVALGSRLICNHVGFQCYFIGVHRANQLRNELTAHESSKHWLSTFRVMFFGTEAAGANHTQCPFKLLTAAMF